MVVATAVESVPKYFPDELDLPLPSEHKTWHTERLCPPLLAQALGSERHAMFVAQLHYWLQKDDVGIYKEGFHWIYNTAWEWLEQFPWMSEYTVGRIRRSLEKLGYVVSNNFSHNPFDRKKYSTLDYYRIAVETGWNPLGLDLNRDYKSPPQFLKGLQLRGRHLSDSTPLVYPTDAPVESESLKLPKIDDCATLQNASSNNATMHSTTLPISSIYKELPNTSKSNPAIDLKIDGEEVDKEVPLDKISTVAENSPTSSVRLQKALNGVAKSSSREKSSAATSLDGDEKIKATQQYIATLNAAQERIERSLPQDRQRPPKPIRIRELDEEVQEILWQYQATLEQLNVDLHASRLQIAIASNPHNLESAILALSENSAQGVKTVKDATGYLYNALRYGWKPRQSSGSASLGVQVYTPPPQMLTQPIPPTLKQLVAQKRVAWQNAIILRPNIKAWVEQTQGVIMTPDGPALADAADTQERTDKEPNAQENPVTPTVDEANSPVDSACNPQLDSNPPLSVEPSPEKLNNQPQPEVQQVDPVATHQTPPPPESDAAPAAVEPSPNLLPTTPTAQQKQPANRRLQPVEILTSAGKWVAGYFVHSCIAVANLVNTERRYTLFDALGQSYRFLGQIRPPQDMAGAT
ncbi:MAG: hypothetical protein N4J56_007930 [Chroococcidiopsis sp. SAG 2025]|uniref:hypothetical protein n=1 Tax=Chroococcidiopsis sp. SAG 2025 TaxID=171389 RepID=UPI00293726B5|nr:hypothetical protein [Chroococcidiopsis sp. SAG 2025]MDV2998225.1 hypothetical protein [Chroococcidiopsis sp. SAG 2025]